MTTMAGSTFLSTKADMKDLPPQGMPDVSLTVTSYFDSLKSRGFLGELASDTASRIACSTDNSIYQIMPQAVAYPRCGSDIDLLVQVAQEEAFSSLRFYPRGGGTSTNGQSLGTGVVVDTSRFMRNVLSFDQAKGLVRVEPGLVRDKLIDFLKPHGRFFAPHVSTTSRATLGGMTSNDSSGKGSVVYGKTSDHVHSIEFVLPNGECVEIGEVAEAGLPTLGGATGELARRVAAILAPHVKEIQKRFPDMKRGFTGYNLKEARNVDGSLNLAKLVAGSEGTLGFIKSITLKAEPIPAHTVLTVLVYPSHEAGLRAVPGLLEARPHAIEFIDDKILGAALRSPFANDVRDVLGIEGDGEALAAHFFEMSDDDGDTLDRRLQEFLAHFETLPDAGLRPIGVKVLRDRDQIARVWEIRRACQGLLAGFDRNKRAVAFIEDCAVPPENLADFVGELEAVLSAKNIPLGMYGHADVGCVHIRPLMNLNSEDERRQIREISDAVFDLTRKYGGLLWGEHGKGLRGEYSEQVIGAALYKVMQQIKGAFDPLNRMNPGKIAHPDGSSSQLLALDGVTMRGEFDQQITPDLAQSFSNMLRCDGNGACFNQDETQAFCPSYKATGDRRLSPKGRAGMLREWARSLSQEQESQVSNMTEALHEVLDTCLACKTCAGAGCPANVDIPEMKSQFLEWYHRSQPRPLSDLMVANLERLAPVLDHFGGIANWVQSTKIVKKLMADRVGLVDIPKLRSRREFKRALNRLEVPVLAAEKILAMQPRTPSNTVVLVQDCFTSFYDSGVVLAQIQLIKKLGFCPIVLRYREGGKPLHVRGMRRRFKSVATRQAHDLAQLDHAGFTLVGVDSATTLMYRHEYPDTLTDCPEFRVKVLSEWLSGVQLPRLSGLQSFAVIQHCTERALVPETSAQWVQIFDNFGINFKVVNAGCCGMSGLFGHEKEHQDISKTLYDQNWRRIVEAEDRPDLIATGYSCRSQIKRLSQVTVLHPAEAILRAWQ